jgi:5-methylcytosine-specific restriction enzyme A
MRQEFPGHVKLAAWEASRDKRGRHRCAICKGIIVGRAEYDHIKPDALGGLPTLENCQVTCKKCHKRKTHTEDRPIITKADNQRKSFAGIERRYKRKIPSRPFNYGRAE